VDWFTQAHSIRKQQSLTKHCIIALVSCRSKKLNVLLVFVPLAAASAFVGWSDTVVFVLNFIAMVRVRSAHY
jgi:hypothetical protein